MQISIIGAGYVGLVSAGCFAKLGDEVICADINEQKIHQLTQGNVPIYEPGLEELIKEGIEKERLKFTSDISEAIKHGDVIFTCVGTPSNSDGSANTSAVLSVAEHFADIKRSISKYKILVLKSTVPPGTARTCYKIIKSKNVKAFGIVSNPEFLKEGSAIQDFMKPDRIIVGSPSKKARKKVIEAYHGVLRIYVPIIETENWETAELIKYANNAFLATKISFINEMANIAEQFNADIETIATAIGLDYRINPRFLHPGVGFGGSCLPKDLRAIIKRAEQRGYQASFLREVLETNERQKKHIVEKIKQVYGSLQGKVFAILGLSFKPKTDDMREAPSIIIINELLALGARIKAYDPKAIPNAKKIFKNKIEYCSSIDEAMIGSNGIIIVTEWDEFRDIDYSKFVDKVADRRIFDGRNIYDPKQIKRQGFKYYGIGRA